MAKPTTWRDTVQARAHELETEGLIGPLADTKLFPYIALTHDNLLVYLYGLAGDTFIATLPLHSKYGTPIVPGGAYNVISTLRLGISSFLLGRPIDTWRGPGAPSAGELTALADFFKTVPIGDLWAICFYLGAAEGVNGTDPDSFHVSPKYAEHWQKFWHAVDDYQRDWYRSIPVLQQVA